MFRRSLPIKRHPLLSLPKSHPLSLSMEDASLDASIRETVSWNARQCCEKPCAMLTFQSYCAMFWKNPIALGAWGRGSDKFHIKGRCNSNPSF